MATKLEYRINGKAVEPTGVATAGITVYHTVQEEPNCVDGAVAAAVLYFVDSNNKVVGTIMVDAYMRASPNASVPVLLQVSSYTECS